MAHRSIIDQRHLHHGSENTVLDLLRLVGILNLPEEVLIQPLGFIATQRPVEVRFISFLRRGQEGELRYYVSRSTGTRIRAKHEHTAKYLAVNILDALLPLEKRRVRGEIRAEPMELQWHLSA